MSSEAITRNDLEAILNELFNPLPLIDLYYPVGSYYETSDTTFNPNVAWGGTWSLETEGLVHIGAGSNYVVGDTGGNKNSIIPYHTHSHNISYTQNSSGTCTIATTTALTGTFDIRKYQNSSGTIGITVSGSTGKITRATGSETTVGLKSATATCGETTVTVNMNHGHTVPNHTHTGSIGGGVTATGRNADGTTASVDNTANANMQPYVVVNRWHRTA